MLKPTEQSSKASRNERASSYQRKGQSWNRVEKRRQGERLGGTFERAPLRALSRVSPLSVPGEVYPNSWDPSELLVVLLSQIHVCPLDVDSL